MSSTQIKLTAYASGTLLPIDAVPDPVFAGRMMGDGVAIEPSVGVLVSPCAGRIAQLHAARHACVVEADNGARLLLHIGIDTVLLKGEGFCARVAEGESVTAGQVLIEFDVALLEARGKPTVVVLAVENGDVHRVTSISDQATVACGDPLLVLDSLPAPVAAVAADTADDAVVEAEAATQSARGWAVVAHSGGLHARPCALLAHALKPYAASIDIGAHGKRANARSATAVMGLNVGEGDEVELNAIGSDAGDALEAAVVALETASASAHAAPAAMPAVVNAGRPLAAGQLAGVVAAPGLAIGPALRFAPAVRAVAEAGEGVVLERRALSAALQAVIGDIESAVGEAERRGLADQAGIFAAHRVLAEDPELLDSADKLVAAGKSAAFAFRRAVETQCQALIATANPLLAGRAADLRDVERQVLRKLVGDVEPAPDLPAAEGAIVVADDLLPSDFAALARARVAAIVTVQGGPTSHIAILARAQGIPALVAVGPQLALIAEGTTLIVDADAGVVDAQPSAERLADARRAVEQRAARHATLLTQAHAAATTLDGVRIEVAANIANADDARQAVTFGAEAVGLLRTELLFIERSSAPSVAEQTVAYQAVVDALEGRRAIIRTLDVGADKSLPYIAMPDEENPALGLRGIRLCLAREELLAEQLRALLAVRPLAAVRIMLPMVTDGAEVVATRALLDRLAGELGIAERVELGVMIETPAAALLVDQLAQYVDFFSVGSNDLTQYTLCMDRVNPALAARVDGLHPAVLRLLAQAAQGAQRHGKWFGVCGALASDPVAVPLLLGLGVGELSASPAVIPEIKAVVRRLDRSECERVAQQALQLASPAAVRALVKQHWPWLDATV